MAHPDCGLFRLAEDYRDHLPCEKCEPSRVTARAAGIPQAVLDAVAGLERAYTTPVVVSGVPGPQQARRTLIATIAAAIDAARKGTAA